MGLKLYAIITSPPVRAVLLCAKALGVDLEWIDVDLVGGDHLKPEYLKMNVQHTVPVLDDEGFIVIDSHAIMTYLVSKYAKDDSLYPKDIKKRAIVDHRLHFDSSILFTRGMGGLIYDGDKEISKKQLLALEEAFNITEKLLDNRSYIAGDQLTVADFSIVTSLTAWSVFTPLNEARFPKISAWLLKLQALPYYQDANQKGLDKYFQMVENLLSK